MKNEIRSIENLFFMLKADFEEVRGDFMLDFLYNPRTKLYTHKHGANIHLYQRLSTLPIRKLPKMEQDICKKSYNLGGIICTPDHENYGLAIPAFQQVEQYCYDKNIYAAFGHISGNGQIFHTDPIKGVRVPIDFKERRTLRKQRSGSERRV